MRYLKHFIIKVFSCFLVVFLFFSCEEILFETDISEEEVLLLAPQNGAELNFTSVRFNWAPIVDATQYNFQLASPNFQNANQILADVVLDSITEYNASLSENEYEWRVRAMNTNFSTRYASASFSIIDNTNFQDNVITILNPSNAIISNTTQTLFQWSAVEDATGYRIQLINNTDASVVEEMLLLETQFSYTFIDGNYTFQVRAEKDTETTAYTGVSVLIDTVAPNMAQLITPADMSGVTETMTTFTWSREVVEGSNEFDTIKIYSDAALTTLVEEMIATSPYETSLDNGTYYWIVQANDEAGNEGESSTTFSFTKS